MKPWLFLLILLSGSAAVRAQELELDPDAMREMVQAAQQWANENLDEETLAALNEVDRDKVEKFLREFSQRLQSDYVLDLAALKSAASAVLPLLLAHEETADYAVWLKSRLDYFDVAEELRRATPEPKPTPGQPRPPLPNPAPEKEREVWVRTLSPRPLPKGAEELVPKLKPIFTRERVPAELVWIAEVESTFNPKARSPVGAAGLFQLMPETAKRLGLRRWPRDQRYQPEPSAQAAARYLRELHGRFGDWPLAVAAYNAGAGRVQKLLDQHNARSFDAIATKLPAETQLFVPKVEATILKREGVKLAKLAAPEGSKR